MRRQLGYNRKTLVIEIQEQIGLNLNIISRLNYRPTNRNTTRFIYPPKTDGVTFQIFNKTPHNTLMSFST